MTQNPNPTPPVPGQTPAPGDPPGQTPPTPQGQTPQGQQQQKTPLTDLPPDVQDYIKLLRQEAKQTREQLEAQARAKQEEDERLKQEQGQFRDLAEQRKVRISELEPYKSRYDALADLLKGQIETQVKEWPAEAHALVKGFEPAVTAPIEERLAWLDKSRPIVEQFKAQKQGQAPGNSPNPQPAGQPGKREGVEEHLQRLRAQRGPVF